jgi:predicted dehydrogenase
MNFGIIGCGRISRRHVDAILSNSNAKLIALCDVVDEKMDVLIKEHNLNVKKYLDYNELLENKDIDIVSIATPSGLHAKIAIDAMNAGKHVICEKPMALTLKDANDMIETSKNTGKQLGICLQNRFNKTVVKLRTALENNRFEKLFLGNATIRWSRPDSYYHDDWHGTIAQDGGCLMNQSIHNIDLLNWMMGDIESLYAYSGKLTHKDIEVEDVAVVAIKFKSGALGIIESTTSIFEKNLEETLSIFGTKGSVVLGGVANNKLNFWKFEDKLDDLNIVQEEVNEEIKDIYGFGHPRLYSNFINALNGSEKLLVCGEEGKKSLEIVLAILKSSKSKQEVKFPLITDMGNIYDYY